MGNVNMEAYQVHYKGDESVADHLRQLDLDVEKAAALPDLPTAEGKTVLTAVTDSQGDTELTYEAPEVEGEDIAPAFSEESAYSEGDLVYYDGILYKFAADHTAGVWDPSEVTQTTVSAEFNELKNTLSGLTTGAFGTGVDMASYNNSSSAYTAPNDGYVEIKTASTVVGAGYNVYVIASNSANIYDLAKTCKNINGQVPERDFFFVKKGMKIWVQVAGAMYDQECIYYPLV